MDKLTERGFVSIVGNKPYWIMLNQLRQPWLWVWDSRDERWVEVRQLADADVATYMLYKIPDLLAQTYHNGNQVNPEYGKRPLIETQINAPIIKYNFDKVRGSIVNIIRNTTNISDLKIKLEEALKEITELIEL